MSFLNRIREMGQPGYIFVGSGGPKGRGPPHRSRGSHSSPMGEQVVPTNCDEHARRPESGMPASAAHAGAPQVRHHSAVAASVPEPPAPPSETPPQPRQPAIAMISDLRIVCL